MNMFLANDTLSAYQHNQELDEVRAEERNQNIAELVERLTSEGEECDPFGITIHKGVPYVYYNLFEAISELPESRQKELSELLKTGHDAEFGKAIREAAAGYWRKTAGYLAEKRIK